MMIDWKRYKAYLDRVETQELATDPAAQLANGFSVGARLQELFAKRRATP